VHIKVKGKTYKVPLDKLSPADVVWATSNPKPTGSDDAPAPATDNGDNGGGATTPDTPANPGEIKWLGTVLKLGKTNKVIKEYTAEEIDSALFKENKGKVNKLAFVITLPQGFDPKRTDYNVLVTSVTAAGDQAKSSRAFAKTAISKGWVVLTAGGAEGKPPSNSTNFKLITIRAALASMIEEWPAAKQWKYAAGGHSGGAKMAQEIAMRLGTTKNGWPGVRVSGIFSSGCNTMVVDYMKGSVRTPRSQFKNIAIWISNGSKDKMSTPQHAKELEEEFKKYGLRKTKIDIFEGGHSVNQESFGKGLDWIAEEAKGIK